MRRTPVQRIFQRYWLISATAVKTNAIRTATKNAEPLYTMIGDLIDEMSDDSGWANLGRVVQSIQRQEPSFDSRTYGFKKTSDFFRSLHDFEIEERKGNDRHSVSIYIRNRKVNS